MKPEKRVTVAVEKAQDILARYVERGPRDCKNRQAKTSSLPFRCSIISREIDSRKVL
jgi:hypothetical protein